MVIHRLTGDADRNLLFEPKWSSDKLGVISSIDKRLKELLIFQGINYS
jgi:radical SAM superfamily enzyme